MIYFLILFFRLCPRHGHHVQGLYVALDQLHFQGDRQEQGWGLPALWPLQGNNNNNNNNNKRSLSSSDIGC